jgi:hypothetical protein
LRVCKGEQPEWRGGVGPGAGVDPRVVVEVVRRGHRREENDEKVEDGVGHGEGGRARPRTPAREGDNKLGNWLRPEKGRNENP